MSSWVTTRRQNYLAVWAAATGQSSVVADASSIFPILGGAGWFNWYDDSAPGINAVIRGGRTTEIPPTLEAP